MSEFSNAIDENIEKRVSESSENKEIKKHIAQKVDEIIDDVINEEKYTRIEIIEEEDTNENATIVPVENIKLVTTEKEESNEGESNEGELNNEVKKPYEHYKILCEHPKVYTIENYISDEDCEYMISLAKPNLQESVVSDSKGGYKSAGRTSKTSWIDHHHDERTSAIAKKISNLVDIPLENAEKFQVVYYGETNEYRAHYDSWDHDGSEKTLRCIKYGGPRLVTALVYLNQVEEGGSTKFTKLDMDVHPKKGKLLVFNNVYENTINKHYLSEHAGMPVIKGEKYIFNLWFRQYSKSKLYSHFNPGYYEKLEENKKQQIMDKKETEKIESIKVKEVVSNHLVKFDSKKNIYKVDSFVTNDEIDKIISLCSFSQSRYPSAWIKKSNLPNIVKRLEILLDVTSNFFENINIIKYNKGIYHGPFLDAYDITSEKGITYTSRLGQRVQTASIVLGESLFCKFEKLNNSITCNKGSILVYDNVVDSQQRDEDMSHTIRNNTSETVYIANIYIREKDEDGNKISKNVFNFIESENKPKISSIVQDVNEYKSNSKVERIEPPENYMETYHDVMTMFENKRLSRNWSKHKSFSYIFKGDFNYVSEQIVEFKKLVDAGKGLNKSNLEMEYSFSEYKGVVVENVVHEDMLKLLQNYYRTTITNNVFDLGDKQSKRYKANNEPFSRFLHYEILPLIERIVDKKLRPTYTYLSAYIKDSDLPAHTDREDCEYTVSFLVSKDTDWPIYLHKEKQKQKYKGRIGYNPDVKECECITSGENGIIMFCGTDHLHFREKFDGDIYDVLLLHYRCV